MSEMNQGLKKWLKCLDVEIIINYCRSEYTDMNEIGRMTMYSMIYLMAKVAESKMKKNSYSNLGCEQVKLLIRR